MKRRFTPCLITMVLLSVLGGTTGAQSQTQSQTAPATAPQAATSAPAAEAPLTNAGVVKLSKLSLGSEVVVAKINQVKAVDFKLETDDLVALKQQGVSQEVIAAMLKRATAAPAAAAPSGAQFPNLLRSAGDNGVTLKTESGETRMKSVAGDLTFVNAYFTVLGFLNFPGATADLKSKSRRPVFIVHMDKDPRGRIYLVTCESDKDDKTRSVKVGRGGVMGGSAWSAPDSDWTVPYTQKELPDNTWEITPDKDLKPGEYGLLFKGGITGMGVQAELFDFSVE